MKNSIKLFSLMNINYSFLVLSIVFLVSCSSNSIDSIIRNATIYTASDDHEIAEAIAIDDGIIVGIGTDEEILDRFTPRSILDAKGLPVYPGFIDSHAHFLGLGLSQSRLDLNGTSSFEEVLDRAQQFRKQHPSLKAIVGRGWDQNDWKIKQLPNKTILDSLFPDIPVALTRIDGHALLVNQVALDLANIDKVTEVEDGIIIKEDDELTGILIDGPMALVNAILPSPNKEEKIEALKKAQEMCLAKGITTVSDAGLTKDDILLIDELHQQGELVIKIYAMVSISDQPSFEYFWDRGILETDRLTVRSFKVYADGALGSRGAALKENYSDDNHRGILGIEPDSLQMLAYRLANSGFQMNTHAIGDYANQIVLEAYKKALVFSDDPRWRVEHAQVVDEVDIDYFNYKVIPSIQPTHAVSDMDWAEDRLGEERMKNAYPYKRLLEKSGKVALGSDFPVEDISPFKTFVAAVARQDSEGNAEDGSQESDLLTRKEALKGMTIWGAYANFEEDRKGSLEVGKSADLVILDKDIMEKSWTEIINVRVVGTFINGDVVFSNRFD